LAHHIGASAHDDFVFSLRFEFRVISPCGTDRQTDRGTDGRARPAMRPSYYDGRACIHRKLRSAGSVL